MSNKIWKYIYYQTRVNKIISKLSNETLENDKKTNYFAYLIPVLRIHLILMRTRIRIGKMDQDPKYGFQVICSKFNEFL